MPELPEVETVRLFLEDYIVGKKIVSCSFKSSRVVDQAFFKGSLDKYEKELVNQKIKRIGRKGKYLIFEFTYFSLLAHLGMSGRMLIDRCDESQTQMKKKLRESQQYSIKGMESINENVLRPKIFNPISKKEIFSAALKKNHLYWEMTLSSSDVKSTNSLNQMKFRFFDPRTFGKVVPLDNLHYREVDFYQRLGKDALLSEIGELVSLWPLSKKIKDHTTKKAVRNLKNYLLDQKKIAGIGNIYADEILFASELKPDRRVDTIELDEWKRLIKMTRKVLRKAIKDQGTSFSKNSTDYRLPNHDYGSHQEKLWVYGRQGLDCWNCKKELLFTKISGRSTVFCAYCQH